MQELTRRRGFKCKLPTPGTCYIHQPRCLAEPASLWCADVVKLALTKISLPCHSGIWYRARQCYGLWSSRASRASSYAYGFWEEVGVGNHVVALYTEELNFHLFREAFPSLQGSPKRITASKVAFATSTEVPSSPPPPIFEMASTMSWCSSCLFSANVHPQEASEARCGNRRVFSSNGIILPQCLPYGRPFTRVIQVLRAEVCKTKTEKGPGILGLRGPAAILLISRDACSDSIAKVFCARHCGISCNCRAICCKMGYRTDVPVWS